MRERDLCGGKKLRSLLFNWHVAWQTSRASNGSVGLPRKLNNRCLGLLTYSRLKAVWVWFKNLVEQVEKPAPPLQQLSRACHEINEC